MQTTPLRIPPSTGARERVWFRPAARPRRPASSTASADRPFPAALRHGAELEMVMAAQQGGELDRQRLIEAFSAPVAGIARLYRRSTCVGREELMQEGIVGLLRALERYDPERGIPFWPYASWWVRQAMQQLVSELSAPVVLSDRAQRQLAKIKNTRRRFEQEHRRAPSGSELSANVGLPQSQIQSLTCAERTPRGLDEPARGESGEGATVGELLADPPAEDAYDRVGQRLLAREIPFLLKYLTERERKVIRRRYGIGQPAQTLGRIAPTLGVSAERVRQIEQESLEKLRTLALRGEPCRE